MLKRILAALLFALLACATCAAQAPFTKHLKLTPGKDTKAEVEQALGQPVRQHSETLIEYAPQRGTQKIYVQYCTGTAIAERVVLLLNNSDKPSPLVRWLDKPDRPMASRVNGKGKLEEYFGAPAFLVLIYEGETTKSVVNRVEYYSRELFMSAAPVNLALGKATSQSSELIGGVPGRAVDGNTNGDWEVGSVTHTDTQPQPWWQVDLGAVQQISSIQIWNRTDCCAERLANFTVFVSDQPFRYTDLNATLKQTGVSSYHTAAVANQSLSLRVNQTGRYVRVQLAGTNYLSLAEVEVLSR